MVCDGVGGGVTVSVAVFSEDTVAEALDMLFVAVCVERKDCVASVGVAVCVGVGGGVTVCVTDSVPVTVSASVLDREAVTSWVRSDKDNVKLVLEDPENVSDFPVSVSTSVRESRSVRDGVGGGVLVSVKVGWKVSVGSDGLPVVSGESVTVSSSPV